jgi:hypothetical protein
VAALESPQKSRYADTECGRNDLQRSEGHALVSVLQSIEMDPIQARGFSELILRKSTFLSESCDPRADHDLNIRLQPIRLWAYAALKHPAYKSNGRKG